MQCTSASFSDILLKQLSLCEWCVCSVEHVIPRPRLYPRLMKHYISFNILNAPFQVIQTGVGTGKLKMLRRRRPWTPNNGNAVLLKVLLLIIFERFVSHRAAVDSMQSSTGATDAAVCWELCATYSVTAVTLSLTVVHVSWNPLQDVRRSTDAPQTPGEREIVVGRSY